jgi:hypothetical protein
MVIVWARVGELREVWAKNKPPGLTVKSVGRAGPGGPMLLKREFPAVSEPLMKNDEEVVAVVA